MKILIGTLTMVFFVSALAIAQEDMHVGTFELKSKDYEVEDMQGVIVEEIRTIRVDWTIKELTGYIINKESELQLIDYYIQTYQEQAEKLKQVIEYYKSILEKVEPEAQKCLLRGEQSKS